MDFGLVPSCFASFPLCTMEMRIYHGVAAYMDTVEWKCYFHLHTNWFSCFQATLFWPWICRGLVASELLWRSRQGTSVLFCWYCFNILWASAIGLTGLVAVLSWLAALLISRKFWFLKYCWDITGHSETLQKESAGLFKWNWKGRLGWERRMRSCSDIADGKSLPAVNQWYQTE